MRVSGDVRSLAAALAVVSRAVPARTPVPVLGGVRLRGVEGAVELAATDLDVAVTYRPAGLVAEGEGVVVVPARYLSDLARHLDGGMELDVGSGGEEVELRCGRGTYRLQAFPPDSYPVIPAVDGPAVEVEWDWLRRVPGRVAVCCAKDMSRPALTGVLWELSGEGLTLVATDGTRLAVWECPVSLGEARQVVVSARGLQLLGAVPAPGEGERVLVRLGQNQVEFSTGAWAVCARLLAAPYPAWRQVQPRAFQCSWRVGREEFARALRRAAVVGRADSGLPAVRLAARPGGVLEVDASAQVGRAHEELEAEVEGVPLEVVFNADLLEDGLDALEGERLLFRLAGAQAVAEVSDPGDGGYRYLVLPMRA